jgi:hypothetical protein
VPDQRDKVCQRLSGAGACLDEGGLFAGKALLDQLRHPLLPGAGDAADGVDRHVEQFSGGWQVPRRGQVNAPQVVVLSVAPPIR